MYRYRLFRVRFDTEKNCMFENIEIYYCDAKATFINNALTFKHLNNIKCDSLHHSNTEHDFLKLNSNHEHV